jgi:hypothetical protein
MQPSTSAQTESQGATRKKWQEPTILVERALSVNAQGPGPNAGPGFGPLSGTGGTG